MTPIILRDAEYVKRNMVDFLMESLSGGGWEYPTNSLHRFFKVKVEMP